MRSLRKQPALWRFPFLNKFYTQLLETPLDKESKAIATPKLKKVVEKSGLPIRPDTLSSWLTRVEEKNGLPHLNAHAFRHSVASALIFHGVDPVSVSKRLGHNQVSTTTNIYAHIMSAAEQKNAEILTEVFA